MSADDVQGRVFRALADPTRRRILDLLRGRARTTGELCEALAPLDRCTTMLHLRVLEACGLVVARREGRLRWNYLDAGPIQEIYNRWISRYAGPSVELLQRLRQDLEGAPDRRRGVRGRPGR